jgi:hypothetical protein
MEGAYVNTLSCGLKEVITLRLLLHMPLCLSRDVHLEAVIVPPFVTIAVQQKSS